MIWLPKRRLQACKQGFCRRALKAVDLLCRLNGVPEHFRGNCREDRFRAHFQHVGRSLLAIYEFAAVRAR